MTDEIIYDATVGKPLLDDAKMSMRGVDVFYADKQAIQRQL